MKVTISKGNAKVGKVPNISLPPIATCPDDAPCKGDGCYALKAWKQYPGTRKAWGENLRAYDKDPAGYFGKLNEFMHKNKPRFFRFHVAGDIPDQRYLHSMGILAENHRGVKFLCFTKRHALDYSNIPSNLSVVFSMWPNWGDTDKNMPRAWVDDGTETRIPSNALECQGCCDTCGMCWSLRDLGRDIYFQKH